MKNFNLVVTFEHLTANKMLIKVPYINPHIIDFLEKMKVFTTKAGVRYVATSDSLLLKSNKLYLVGEIHGLNNVLKTKKLTILSGDPETISKVKAGFIEALHELVHIMTYFKHGPGLTTHMAPFIVFEQGDGAGAGCEIEKFTNNLNRKSLISSTLMKPAIHYLVESQSQ